MALRHVWRYLSYLSLVVIAGMVHYRVRHSRAAGDH